eukprot:3333690-Amphidinium_carterae.1
MLNCFFGVSRVNVPLQCNTLGCLNTPTIGSITLSETSELFDHLARKPNTSGHFNQITDWGH